MSELAQSVVKVLTKINRISDPPPYAVFNTAYELLAFADNNVITKEQSVLWTNPFTDVFTLGCAAAVAARSDRNASATFEHTLAQWFVEEALVSEEFDAAAKYFVINHVVNLEVVASIVSCLWSQAQQDGHRQGSIVVDIALGVLQRCNTKAASNAKKDGMLITSAVTVLGHVVPRLEANGGRNATVGKLIVAAAMEAIDATPALVPAVTRQILIPLLSLFPAASAASMVSTLIQGTAGAGRETDVVILAASLFDTLIAVSTPAKCELRSNPLIWEAIVTVLNESIVVGGGGGASASLAERATAQMQALHLLQRIVSLCEDEWGQNLESHRARNKQNLKADPNSKKGKSGKGQKKEQPQQEAEQPAKLVSANSNTRKGDHAFHKYFSWGDGHSAGWGDFFLHFEALNEFSLHICTQVIAKIPALMAQSPSVLHPVFVDLLLRKGLSHPNNGVRKAVIGTLWKELTSRDLGLFKDETLFQVAFVAAADWRLCSEVDRLVVPSNFMEAIERPEEEVPSSVIDPIAEQMCAFYRKALTLPSSSAVATSNSRLLMMINTLTERSSRFTVSMGLRVIGDVCQHVPSLAATQEVCEALLSCHQLALLSRHPMWLEGRLGGIMTEALLTLLAKTKAHEPTIRMGWKALGALASTVEDTLDAPAIKGNSYIGADYVAERTATILKGSDALPLCVRSEFLISDAALAAASSNDEPESEVRDLSLRVGVASFTSPATVTTLLSALLGSLTSLGDRTSAANSIISNTTGLLRGIASALGLARLSSALPAQDSESMLCAALDAVVSTARRLVTVTEGSALVAMPIIDSLSDAAAIILAMANVSYCGDGIATPLLATFADNAVATVATALQAKNGRQTRAALRMLRSALVAFISSSTLSSASPISSASATDSSSPADTLSFASAANAIFGSHAKAADLFNLLTSAPLPLCANEGAASAVHNSESERYLLDLLFLVVPSSCEGPRAVAIWAEDHLDGCVTLNLPTLFGLMAACVSRLKEPLEGIAESEAADIQRRLVRLMMSRAADGTRLQAFRCSAIAYGSLGYCRDDSFVTDVANEVLASEEATDRIIFFVALGVTTKVLDNPAASWEQYRPVLLEVALFINSAAVGDEELECAFAALEPAFAALPESIRAKLPPTTRLLTLARSLAIVAIVEAVTATDSVCPFVADLLMMNVLDSRISHNPCMPNSKTHRSRVRLWQLVHTLLPALKLGDWDTLVPILQGHCLPINNISSVRRPMELMAMLGYQLRPDLINHLLPFLDDYDIRAQVAGTYTQVAINTIRVHQFDASTKVFETLFPRLQRFTNSYQHLLRIIAHIGIHAILTARKEVSELFTLEHARMLNYLNNANEVQKFLVKHYDTVVVDVVAETRPYRTYCVQRMEGTHWLHEGIPAATFGRLSFLAIEVPCAMSYALPLQARQSQELLHSLPAVRMAYQRHVASGLLPAPPAGSGPCDEFLDYTEAAKKLKQEAPPVEATGDAVAEDGAVDDGNIQRKVQSWWTSEIYNQLHPRALGSASRQQLIIVGSLLDNPVNIAGLCRCGDIFAVERVIVPNKKVFEHPHFVAAARSAELWVPWEEVAPRDLTKYLQEMKLEGFTIVGVEQTADSQSMADFKFPTRAVVVLGSEGKGIPAEVLPYLDVCVEIPQFGLIRSLNVHVTGAIAMYEYSVQHVMNASTRK